MVPTAFWLLSMLHLVPAAPLPIPIVYDRLPDTDFSSHTRPGGWERRYGTPEPCGPGDAGGHKLPACNITFLELVCANLCGCAGFNSNGWLKSCSSEPYCTKKHFPGTDSYVGSRPGGGEGCSPAPPHPSPAPPPPHPSPAPPPPPPASQCDSAATTAGAMHGPVEDWHYPLEEPQERAAMMSALPALLSVTATANSSGTAKLTSGGVSATVTVGQLAFGSWQLLAFLRPEQHLTESPQTIDSGTRVVLERRFARWSTLLFLSPSTDGESVTDAAAPPVLIRSGIGEVSNIRQPDYNFSDPCYFERATLHPHDYLGEHLLNTSSFAEPSFVDAGECCPSAKLQPVCPASQQSVCEEPVVLKPEVMPE